MNNTATALLFLLCSSTGLLVLQYFLSGARSPWPGRVLPILSGSISVLYALVVLFSMTGYAGQSFIVSAILATLTTLLVMNIPTLLYLLIYTVRRKKFTRESQVKKMNIQDL